jgi:DNA polymerase I-like protein with 3'-5' exonuclease and polymerase domains
MTPVGKWHGVVLDALTATDAERRARRLSTANTIIEVLGADEDALIHMEELAAYSRKKGLTTFDCETTGLDPINDKIILVQMGDIGRQYLIWWQTITDEMKAIVKDLWMDPEVKKAGVNLKFDAKMLLGNEGIDWRGAGLLDCQIIEQILCCGLMGKIGLTMKLSGMGPMALRWCGIKLVKDTEVRTGWGELTPGVWGVDAQSARVKRNYAADDVPMPILLLEKQLPWIREFELVKTLKLEMAFLPELAEMEILGLNLSVEDWAVLSREAEVGLAKARHDLDILFGVQVTYRTDMDNTVQVTRDRNYASKDELKDLIREWMLDNYGVEVIGANKHLTTALLKQGFGLERLTRILEARMVPNPDKPGTKKRVGYPNMVDYIVGSDFVEAQWPVYRDKLPENALALPDTESKSLKLLKIIFNHPNKEEIDLNFLPSSFGLPPELVDPIVAYRDYSTKLARYAWSWIGNPKVAGDHGIIHPVTGRIHTDTTQTAADTGRLTTRPNFQNLPTLTRKIDGVSHAVYRECIRARPGFKMIGADFNQIEPRIIGEISLCPTYMRVFWSDSPGTEGFDYWCGDTVTEPLDLYGAVGAGIGVLPNDAERKTVAKLPVNSKGRKKSKIAVLGLGYGMQKWKFYISYLLDMGAFYLKSESDDLFDGFWSVALEVKEALDALSAIAYPGPDEFRWSASGKKKQVRTHSPRYVVHPYVEQRVTWSESLGGRKRFFTVSQAKRSWTQGRNHPIQATGADILKEAVVHVNRAFRAEKLVAWLVLTAHDELLGEARRDHAARAAAIMEEQMSIVGEAYCPHVPITAEAYVEDFWLKD